MKFIPYPIVLVFVFLISCKDRAKDNVEKSNKARPNIIYILTDDLGYGDLGVYGQEKIATPNIDALANNGILFTQHYSSAPVCAPARNMLMAGVHSGHAYIRGNDEWEERGNVWDYRAMAKDSTLEGQRPLPDTTVTIAKKLQEQGYKTAAFGKWGLGAPHTNAIPTKMGFDYFYGYNGQRQAHTYYPLHLYENEKRVHLNNDTVPPHTGFSKNADPYNMDSYAKYTLNDYAPALTFEKLTGFIDKNKNKPFFVYWATPIPHVALQAPKHWVDYYVDKYGDEKPYTGSTGYFPNRYPNATYAAMISYLDENVGKLVAQLKRDSIYDNTLIIFTSDNGPTDHGGVNPEYFNSARPFKSGGSYGKGHLNEGGIRVPMIASWPNKINPGSRTDHISAQYDVMATLADVAGFKKPGYTDGISFYPTLLGQDNQKEHEFLYWEFPEYGGQVAIRMGDWKVLRKNLKNDATPTLELYNLKTDPAETTNVADKHPDILAKAAEIYKREHIPPIIDKFKIPLIENGLLSDQKP